MSYLGINLNVTGSSTINDLTSTTLTSSGPINGDFWSGNTQHIRTQTLNYTIVSFTSTLPAVYLNSFFGYMIELSGTLGNTTLTTETATNIYNYETTPSLPSRGGITTIFNNSNGIVTLAAGTGVTIRGTLAIPAGKAITARVSISSTSATIHIVLSA